MHRDMMGLAAAAIAVCAGGVTAQTTVFRITDRETRALATDYTWGYWCGVKQPLGSFHDGLSIHEVAKSTFPTELLRANPDYLLWVDEEAQTFGIAERPTSGFAGNVENPGGQATFAENGTIWYTYGGRAQDLPLDLFRSDTPHDFEQFTKILDDYEDQGSSTTPCVQVHNGKVMLAWRHGFSASPNATVRFRRYDIAQGFTEPEFELDIGQGVVSPLYGDVGIEQLWTRFDPRFGYLFLSWQWYDHSTYRMGATPYLYSDDHGTTWRRADGTPLTDLPLSYDEIDATITPFDHIGTLGGGSTDWMVADIGVSPAGTPWLTTPRGNASNDNWKVDFWRFDGAAWQRRTLTGSMLGNAKPHACGATRDYLVFAYAELNEPYLLKIRVSKDGGETWSDPIVADTIDPQDTISWVSFVQPSEGYPDDVARFFYGHFRTDAGITGQRYQNSIRWIRMEIEDTPIPPPTGLVFSYPEGLPGFVSPDQPTQFRVQLSVIGEGIPVEGSGFQFVSVNGAPFEASAMTLDTGSTYFATLPAVPCLGTIDYYLSGAMEGAGFFADPPSAPILTYRSVAAIGTGIVLRDEIEDDLSGWTVVNDAALISGAWGQADPNGTISGASLAAPENDATQGTANVQAFVTENGPPGGDAFTNDVDGGPTTLISPVIDLAGTNGTITYARWFFSDNGDDELTVDVTSDGLTWIPVPEHATNGTNSAWQTVSFVVSDYVTPSATVQVRFVVGDLSNNSVTEAGVDNFLVERFVCVETDLCTGDLDDDGEVGFTDLTALLGQWGPCPILGGCGGDLDANDVVGFADLTALLGLWGGCLDAP